MTLYVHRTIHPFIYPFRNQSINQLTNTAINQQTHQYIKQESCFCKNDFRLFWVAETKCGYCVCLSQCISLSEHCDREQHCINGADEINPCDDYDKWNDTFTPSDSYSDFMYAKFPPATVYFIGTSHMTVEARDNGAPCNDTHFECPQVG